MDIDDGTSAWGDPNSYNYKNVNLWDKNSQGGPAPREANLPTPMTGKSASGRRWLFLTGFVEENQS
jgi:trinucleotide repeat-containing gene 6 protein